MSVSIIAWHICTLIYKNEQTYIKFPEGENYIFLIRF